MYALRCGLGLVMDYAYPDQWELASQKDTLSKRDCRKAAKHFQDALEQREGHEAIAAATEGFGHAMAKFWRRAADPETRAGTETPEELRPGLLVSASFSDSLAELVAHTFAPEDPHGILEEVASAELRRGYNPENDEAMGDLRDCAARAGVAGRAVALALGSKFEEFGVAVVGPIMYLNLTFDAAALANWGVVGEYWANVLQPEPSPYSEMMSAVAAAHGT